MILSPLTIAGAFQLDIERAEDERGFFARCFCREEWLAHGVDFAVAQCSVSVNRVRHTLRGMHYQKHPHGETKVVRCTSGSIWDCIVDLRPNSPTFRQWVALELSETNHRSLFIPEQCAHGFLTLTPESEVFYMISSDYKPQAAAGVRWNDPAFGIDWPAAPDMISARDGAYPDFTVDLPC